MYHIGVDLHKDSMTIATINDQDKKMKVTEIPCKCIGKVTEFFSQFSGKECRVLVEAVGFYHWFWDAERISSVPGVGKTATPPIIAEVGDFKRFADPQRLASFAGLVPRVFQSGDSCRHGRITKKGPAGRVFVLMRLT